jgi:hypothetical protein
MSWPELVVEDEMLRNRFDLVLLSVKSRPETFGEGRALTFGGKWRQQHGRGHDRLLVDVSPQGHATEDWCGVTRNVEECRFRNTDFFR